MANGTDNFIATFTILIPEYPVYFSLIKKKKTWMDRFQQPTISLYPSYYDEVKLEFIQPTENTRYYRYSLDHSVGGGVQMLYKNPNEYCYAIDFISDPFKKALVENLFKITKADLRGELKIKKEE